MNPLYDWLAHAMIGRNIRFIRAGLVYRWFFLAFWISFAALVITRWTALKFVCGALLLCSVVARAWWRRRNRAEIEKLIKESDEHAP